MRTRETISIVAAAATLGFAVLAVGGALRWTAAVVALLVAASQLPMVLSRRGLLGVSPLVVVLAIATAFTALQLVPIPDSWLAALDPTGQSLRDGAGVVDISPWSAITLDAPGTLHALGFLITLVGIAVVGLRFASSERGRLVCLGGVAAVCGVTAIIVGVHRVFGATELYGMYEPVQATPPILGPLLNANHLGGLMALGLVVSVGLFFYIKQSMAARVTWMVIAVGCLVVMLASLSRGALLAGATGLFVTLGVYVAQRLARPVDRRARSSRRRFIMTTLPIGTVATCILVTIIYTSAGTAAEQLENTKLQEISEPRSKFAAWRSSAELLEESPWVGVGRGALEPAFTRVHPASAFVTFSHLENEYLQAVVEWGIPGAIVLAAAMVWLALVAIRRWRDGPLAAAALGGVAAVTVQSNVDFGVELLGLAVPLVVVAATLTYVPFSAMSHGAIGRARIGRALLIGALVATAWTLLSPATTTIEEDHLALDGRPPMPEVLDELTRHPLDYYGYAIGAEVALRDQRGSGAGNAIAMLNHALVLHPTHAGLHRFAGRLLLASHHLDQAAIEYAAALRGTGDPRSLLAEIVHGFPAEQAADAIPTDYDNVEAVVKAVQDLQAPAVALVWVQRVTAQHSRAINVFDLQYDLAIQLNDLASAEAAMRARLAVIPSNRATLQLAQLVDKRKNHDEVLKLLGDVESWHGRVEDQLTAWLLLCDTRLAVGDIDQTERCLHRLDGEGLVTAARRGELTKRLDELARIRRERALLGDTGSGVSIPMPPSTPRPPAPK